MVEQQRLMEEERQRMRKEHEKRVKEEQKKILGKNNSRPKLSFTLKPITWVCLISCSFTCDIYTPCRFLESFCIPRGLFYKLRLYKQISCAASRSKVRPNVFATIVEIWQCWNSFIRFRLPRVRRNWIIDSMLARFRSPLQMGSYLLETTLLSKQEKRTVEPVLIYLS